ncbi:hypothetical protein [Falsiroseomonas sp.]|uniref:hypothetical protein n=1 Tax=Falsiroseomonas sp. TaxID=2870721 RepID=UPI0035648B9C
MTLHLVIHRPDAAEGSTGETAIRAALSDAVWEVADSHWAPCKEAVLVSTDLSPDYLLAHFRQALAQRGHTDPGMLLVVPVGPTASWSGMPADAEAWIAEVR